MDEEDFFSLLRDDDDGLFDKFDADLFQEVEQERVAAAAPNLDLEWFCDVFVRGNELVDAAGQRVEYLRVQVVDLPEGVKNAGVIKAYARRVEQRNSNVMQVQVDARQYSLTCMTQSLKRIAGEVPYFVVHQPGVFCDVYHIQLCHSHEEAPRAKGPSRVDHKAEVEFVAAVRKLTAETLKRGPDDELSRLARDVEAKTARFGDTAKSIVSVAGEHLCVGCVVACCNENGRVVARKEPPSDGIVLYWAVVANVPSVAGFSVDLPQPVRILSDNLKGVDTVAVAEHGVVVSLK